MGRVARARRRWGGAAAAWCFARAPPRPRSRRALTPGGHGCAEESPESMQMDWRLLGASRRDAARARVTETEARPRPTCGVEGRSGRSAKASCPERPARARAQNATFPPAGHCHVTPLNAIPALYSPNDRTGTSSCASTPARSAAAEAVMMSPHRIVLFLFWVVRPRSPRGARVNK